MRGQIIFITGTDTGVGKTVFADLLTRGLRLCGRDAVALKPICSGGRSDAQALRAAADDTLSLDEVNPWHFHAPVAPVLAARREGTAVQLAQVANYVRSFCSRFEVVVVEGAGGLLSPLGEGFDSRDLLLKLNATPIIVVSNRLGVVNQIRLVMEALPSRARRPARVVLIDPARMNLASSTNVELLRQFVPERKLRGIPWLTDLKSKKKWLSAFEASKWVA